MTLENQRLKFLDGLRGWASLMVLLSHLIAYFLGFVNPQLNFNRTDFLKNWHDLNFLNIAYGELLRFSTDGHLAVLIFFVLSGYALSSSLLNKKKLDFDLIIIARYFRLLIPVLFFSFIAYLAMKFDFHQNKSAAIANENLKDWLGTFYLFDADLFQFFKFCFYDVFFQYDEKNSYNPVLWTMTYELYGSLLLYIYFSNFKKNNTINYPFLLSIIAILLFAQPYLACFFTGYFIVEIKNKFPTLKSLGIGKYNYVVSFVLPLVLMGLSNHFRGNNLITSLLANLIVLSVAYSSSLQKFFQNKFSNFLGRISFPLYLIQMSIICTLSSYLFLELPKIGFDLISSSYINIFITITVCFFVSYALIPIDRLGVNFSKKIAVMLLK